MKPMSFAGAATLALLLHATPVLAERDHAGHVGHDEAFPTGEPGNARKPARIVQVTMTEANGKMLFAPARVEVGTGEQVKFVLRNAGELEHEFVLGTTEENLKHAGSMSRNPDMEHDDPNAAKLAPKRTGEIVWKFSRAGAFEYACLIPGHREAGMVGDVVVK